MKYKIGDKIRVRNLKYGYISPDGTFFNDEMEELVGKEVTIAAVIKDHYKIKEDKCEWNWVDDFLENVEFSKDLITDLSIITLDNGDKLVYVKERDEFYDLTYDQHNYLSEIKDINSDGRVEHNRIVKIEQPKYKTIYSDNEVREMTVEEISKVLGYEVKIVKEKR